MLCTLNANESSSKLQGGLPSLPVWHRCSTSEGSLESSDARYVQSGDRIDAGHIGLSIILLMLVSHQDRPIPPYDSPLVVFLSLLFQSPRNLSLMPSPPSSLFQVMSIMANLKAKIEARIKPEK